MLSLARSGLYKVYGVGCWGLFFVVGLAGLLATLPIPDLHLRRHVTRTTARVFLFLAGFRLRVRGLEWLPDGACVVVANHASYLDGIVLHAVLPVRFAFIIKKEMVTVPLAGFLLRRVGSEFVDRVDRHRAAADVKRVLKRAASGEALACFPEGTFAAHPGVHRFHAGAFVAAARSGLDVVPAVILGTRAILPDGRALPRPGRIEVEILARLPVAASEERDVAVNLRLEARRLIMDRLGEPDLDTGPRGRH